MAGGTGTHALIAMNIGSALRPRLRGGPCAPYGSDLKVYSPAGAFRYPDVTVDCSLKTDRATFAQDPRIVMEALSAANDTKQITRLMHDDLAIESLTAIVFISQDAPFVQLYARDGASWRAQDATGLEASITLPGLAASLPLTEIYESVTFEEEGG
jgi:Uma2 family endonuclease